MTEEQINHALRYWYGCRSEDINDPSREPEAAILDQLHDGPAFLPMAFMSARYVVARYRLLLSRQIEPDPNGWRISKTLQKQPDSATLSAETGLTEPKE